MENLSAEERACLMYLEETIEALEVQEDSGLSNDEPDSVLDAEKKSQMTINDIFSFKSESLKDQQLDKVEHHTANETSEAQPSPASVANTKDLETSENLVTQPKPSVAESVTGCDIHPSAPQSEGLCLSRDEDGHTKIVSSLSESTQASEIDLSLIPPPSDFMDEPAPPPQPETANDVPPSPDVSSNKPRATVDLRQMYQRASTSVSSSVTQEPPNKAPETRLLAANSGHQIGSNPETVEPRSPPAVAPKPKKLPANIILKSHKAAVADGNSGHLVSATSDRLILDPQRVRLEALRKLGLLKSDEADSGPTLSPKLSPQTRSRAASSPISPAAPHTPPTTPSYTRLSSPSVASVPPQSPSTVSPSGPCAVPIVQPSDIVPAPAAFSDPNGPLVSDNELSTVRDVSGATANAQVSTPPRTPPALIKQLTPPQVNGAKSATLECSGPSLSSYSQDYSEASQGVSDKQSPSQLRNSRPRPASLGSRKEFSSVQGEGSQLGHATRKEPDLRRSLPAFQHSGDSQKLPRSQGISVLICPRAENGNDRREALKRLGLLRD
nr:specifically androgen-regulated gene protein-like isoform X2 [Scatophagus argus]